MALLTVANLVLSFGDRRILDGASMTLSHGEHVGLVGRNGCGKSTLLKQVAGMTELKPEGGQIQVARGATVGYLHQDPNLGEGRTLREEAGVAFAHLNELHERLNAVSHEMASAEGEALEKLLKRYERLEHEIEAAGGFAVEHRIDATLHGVGLGAETFNVPVTGLSGGQKGRLALAKLLLSEPDVLLLDEPTNHLDIAGRQWLEEYLAAYAGAVVLVSHDRWLLNRVVSQIYELEDGRLYDYPGNYETYRELREERRTTQYRAYEKQQDKIKKEQAYIDRYRAGQRARQAKGREKRLERYVRDQAMDRPTELGEITLRIKSVSRSGEHVLTADGIAKGYDGKQLFGDLHLAIKRGDRIGVIGPNGAGKSTLVRCMIGEQDADAGRTRVGTGVSVGHYQQTHEHLDMDRTIIEYLQPLTPNQTEQEARDLAGAFLFTGLEQDKPLGVLSGGERSRAVLAGLIAQGHNLLVLDEPTNHLDIQSAERLEDALREYTKEPKTYGQSESGGGTLILITHDRMLLDDLVDQLLVLDGHGNVRHFLGTYSDYIAAQQAKSVMSSPAAPSGRSAKDEKSKKNTAPKPSPKKRQGSGLSHLNQEQLEQRIIKVEQGLTEVDASLADPDVYRDGGKVRKLQGKRQKLLDELGPLEEEWAARAEA